jgi:hypothetical protein
MSSPIDRLLRAPHTARQRQLGKRRTGRTAQETLADLFAENHMKIQTDVKAGGGLLDLCLDLDIDLDISLFGCGGKKRGPRKGKGGC